MLPALPVKNALRDLWKWLPNLRHHFIFIHNKLITQMATSFSVLSWWTGISRTNPDGHGYIGIILQKLEKIKFWFSVEFMLSYGLLMYTYIIILFLRKSWIFLCILFSGNILVPAATWRIKGDYHALSSTASLELLFWIYYR